jgi:hypothetical protein
MKKKKYNIAPWKPQIITIILILGTYIEKLSKYIIKYMNLYISKNNRKEIISILVIKVIKVIIFNKRNFLVPIKL